MNDREIHVANNVYRLLNLSNYFNNDGISSDELKCDGDFDDCGATYPAEELPPSNTVLLIDSIPFNMPSKEPRRLNNFVLQGQTIPVIHAVYSTIYVLGASSGVNGASFEEEITVSFIDGTYRQFRIGFGNWLLEPKYTEKEVALCSHLHFPDPGQTSISNREAIGKYKENYEHSELITYEKSNNKKLRSNVVSNWEPKIYLDNIKIDCKKPITGLTFLNNEQFHIFAITLMVWQ
jgi:hypothetical protein